jgi:hypothetical protein
VSAASAHDFVANRRTTPRDRYDSLDRSVLSRRQASACTVYSCMYLYCVRLNVPALVPGDLVAAVQLGRGPADGGDNDCRTRRESIEFAGLK